jgi:hypothetical protein
MKIQTLYQQLNSYKALEYWGGTYTEYLVINSPKHIKIPGDRVHSRFIYNGIILYFILWNNCYIVASDLWTPSYELPLIKILELIPDDF